MELPLHPRLSSSLSQTCLPVPELCPLPGSPSVLPCLPILSPPSLRSQWGPSRSSASLGEGGGFVELSLCLSHQSLPGAVVLRTCTWGTPVLEIGCRQYLGLGVGREQLSPQATSRQDNSRGGGCAGGEVTPEALTCFSFEVFALCCAFLRRWQHILYFRMICSLMAPDPHRMPEKLLGILS